MIIVVATTKNATRNKTLDMKSLFLFTSFLMVAGLRMKASKPKEKQESGGLRETGSYFIKCRMVQKNFNSITLLNTTMGKLTFL